MRSSSMTSRLEMTRLQWAGKNLRRTGPVQIDLQDVVARVQSDHYSVLYLRSGEKILVRESLEEIERLRHLTETQREVLKRFKRDIRECKAMGMSVENSFAALWEEVATQVQLPEEELSKLYKELLDWTKRWLK